MARARVIGIAVGAGAGAAGLLFSFQMAGGGHGTYAPAVALFPFSMLSTLLTHDVISPAAIAFALLQFPIYGFVAASMTGHLRTRAIIALGAVHITAIAVSFMLLHGRAFI
jgi:hypothetical protein